MSEPFGNKWKQYKIWPAILGQSGNSVDKIKLNIGSPSSLQGVQGVQGVQGIAGTQGAQGITGTQGTNGNPSMQLIAPDGGIWEITVTTAGLLNTVLITPGSGQANQGNRP